jgi:hypothetical protein
MEFKTTFSREYLQGVFTRVKTDHVKRAVEGYAGVVQRTAQQGGLRATVDFSTLNEIIKQYAIYKITVEDIVEGLRLKCPGCKVEYEEKWEPSPLNPNQMDKKSGITIDWS